MPSDSTTEPRTPPSAELLHHTLAQILARRGDAEALTEVESWLSQSGNAPSVAASAFEITLSHNPGRKADLVTAALGNGRYCSVRAAALPYCDDDVQIARHVYDRSNLVQTTARDLLKNRASITKEAVDVLNSIIQGLPHLTTAVDDIMDEGEPLDPKIPYPTRARLYALDAVARPGIDSADLTRSLLALLDDDDPELRYAAVEALRYPSDPKQLARTLIDHLDQDRPVHFQMAAIACLRHLHIEEAIPTLERFATGGDTQMQRQAVLGLAAFHTPEIDALLRQCWENVRAPR
jgi:hypothetical protein